MADNNIQSYRDLLVWQKSMKLAKVIYFLVKKLPKEETYSLSDQMRRAATSIPSNIAEGYERHTKKEYSHFLFIARGSNAELNTLLQLCIDIDYLTENEVKEAIELSNEIGKILTTIIKKLTPSP